MGIIIQAILNAPNCTAISLQLEDDMGTFPGGPAVEYPPSSAGDSSLIEELSPCAANGGLHRSAAKSWRATVKT